MGSYYCSFCILIILLLLCVQTRPAAINLLKTVDLAGKDGIVSELSPGVFVQVVFYPLIWHMSEVVL